MIIKSLMDTDLYKFTMAHTVLHHPSASGAQVEYEFKNRTANVDLNPFAAEIRREIGSLCSLRFAPRELEYLRGLRYLKSDFVDFLRIFQLDPNAVSVHAQPDGLQIKVRGSWLHTILFEVPILAIVNEVYFRSQAVIQEMPQEKIFENGMSILDDKLDLVKDFANAYPSVPFVFSEFGTRRRFSCEWQEEAVRKIVRTVPANFAGTSNVDLAMRYGLTARGTMAHEFLQAFQGLGGVQLADAQKAAFESWVKEYRGDMGIALTDVMGIDAFLRDFDLYFCKLFDGVRHDSGDPYEWTEKIIAHYRANKIDPKTKTAVYSDGLTIPKALALCFKFQGQINTVFGIGTNLTNDVGFEPLAIVMKMTRCNGRPVAKVSDSRGKTMCDDEKYLWYLKQVYQIKD